jgi:hypothetical protein
MRAKLIPHLHQLVLCKGWIDGWEDFASTNSRRVCVKQPTIKVADKNVLFANQKVIAKEHHINLFIPYELLGQYEAHFITHTPISFSGVVVEYQRRNGSVDYGITATPQERLQLDLKRLSLAVEDIGRASPFNHSTLSFYEHTALPQVLALEERLEQAGNSLPTFDKTYGEYKKLLLDMRVALSKLIERTKYLTSSRAFRRRVKGRSNLLAVVKSM